MIEELKEVWRFRELLITMVQRDLRVRYKNSFLGFLWSFVTPLATTLVMTLVFSVFLRIEVKSYSAYILSAYLPYMFLQTSILDSSQSVLVALPVVKKIYFPREILPLSSVITNFIHLLLGFVVLFLYLFAVYLRYKKDFPIQPTIIYLPVLLLISLMLATGFSFLVSALNTFYEDVKYIVSILMYLMFFLCPVMYFVEMVAHSSINREPYFWVYHLYNLNPFAALCIAFRKVILAGVPVPGKGPTGNDVAFLPIPLDWKYIGACALVSFVVLIYGYSVFNRLKWRFVERP